ncbi:hypothetical protein [Paenacidovorax monticola]
MSEMESGRLAEGHMPVPRAHREGVFRMPLFKPGTHVRYGRHSETVSHIVVRRQQLSVYLVGRESPVRPDQLELEPVLFTTQRRPDPLLY